MSPAFADVVAELIQSIVLSAVVPVALATSLTVLLFALQWLVMTFWRND